MTLPTEMPTEWKRALIRNPELRLGSGIKVQVPAGTKRVFVPRQKHHSKTVLTDVDDALLVSVGEELEPCTVMRGAFGFGLHECKHHNGTPGHPVYFIDEK